MNKQKKRKGLQKSQMRCPYCGSTVEYRSADGIYHDNSNGTMLYVCSRYPECDSYVRVHAGTKIPVGSLANHELRSLRRTAPVSYTHLDVYKRQDLSRCMCRSKNRVGYPSGYLY